MQKPPEYVEKFDFDPDKIRVHNPIIRFLGGLKLGLSVLTLIAIASTVGEFLPYENDYSIQVVFKTWWYQGLLFLMGVNLILNTYMTYIEETYPQYLPLFRKNPDGYKTLKISHKVKYKDVKTEDSRTLMNAIASVFHKRGYRTFFDGSSFYGHRGLVARFGSTVTHLGLITIIVGSLAEAFFRVGGTVRILEEDTIDYYLTGEQLEQEHKLDFDVTLHDFEFTKYPGTETAAKYKSTVTFQPKDGSEPTHTYVRVNHDVTYRGWTFHQTSFSEIERERLPRYFVNLNEKLPDEREQLHQFEMYLPRQGREIKPLPGHDDRFFAVEPDPSGRNVIWSVASKDEILSRGVKSIFGSLEIEMIRFYNDLAVEQGQVFNKSAEMNNPAAYIEVTSNNSVAFRQWVFLDTHDPHEGHDHAPGEGHDEPESQIEFVITDVRVEGNQTASAGGGPMLGAIDGASLSQSETTPIAERAVVTVAMRNHLAGGGITETYELRLGKPIPLTGHVEQDYAIEGPYELEGFHTIPAYVDFLDISRNPGIPIVWLGAILASFGPFIAFFVSRRRVWAWVDTEKKTVWIGGDSRYSREALEEEVKEAVLAWADLDEVKIEPKPDLKPGDEPPPLSQYL